MSLQAVQQFLSTYQRDPEFRQTYRSTGATGATGSTGLTDEERGLIEQIDLDYLDKRALATLSERMNRSSAVFALLFNHLDRYVDLESFYREFDRRHTRGWWQRRAEIRRFESYVLDFVVEHNLPEYLVDLCRFCSVTTTVAETPKSSPPGYVDLPGITDAHGSYQVALRKPYEVLTFRHDVLALVENPHPAPLPSPTTLLVQRDWGQHKRSRVLPVHGDPVLAELATGPATVFELAGRVPHVPYRPLLGAVARLYGQGVVHLIVPPEIASDLTAPAEKDGKG